MASRTTNWLAAVGAMALTFSAARAADESAPAPNESAPERPTAYVLPPPGWPPVEFAAPDRLLDRGYAEQPGPYANVDLNLLSLHLRNQLNIPVLNGVTGAADKVQFDGNKLDMTVSPRFELGYRFEDGFGAVQLSYRFLSTRGVDQLTTGLTDAFQGTADQLGRLDYNLADLDYVSREYSLDPNWALRWSVGVRLSTLYFDSNVNFLHPNTSVGSVLLQSESNSLWSVGAHAVFDISRKLPIEGLSVFGRIEGVGNVGRVEQTGRELIVADTTGGTLLSTNRLSERTVGDPMASWIVGLAYEPHLRHHCRFMVGYEYETWWEIGRVVENNSAAQLDANGVFFRAEFNY